MDEGEEVEKNRVWETTRVIFPPLITTSLAPRGHAWMKPAGFLAGYIGH